MRGKLKRFLPADPGLMNHRPSTCSQNGLWVCPNTTMSGCSRWQPILQGLAGLVDIDNVLHEEFAAAQFNHFGMVKKQGGIGVAGHDCHGRDLLEALNNGHGADVTGV